MSARDGGADHSASLASSAAETLGSALRSGDLADDVTGGVPAEDWWVEGEVAFIELEDGSIYRLEVSRQTR